MKLGRVFRKMGLPMWTFIGVGMASIWFNYFGTDQACVILSPV